MISISAKGLIVLDNLSRAEYTNTDPLWQKNWHSQQSRVENLKCVIPPRIINRLRERDASTPLSVAYHTWQISLPLHHISSSTLQIRPLLPYWQDQTVFYKFPKRGNTMGLKSWMILKQVLLLNGKVPSIRVTPINIIKRM